MQVAHIVATCFKGLISVCEVTLKVATRHLILYTLFYMCVTPRNIAGNSFRVSPKVIALHCFECIKVIQISHFQVNF
jgi:hypothetical protein